MQVTERTKKKQRQRPQQQPHARATRKNGAKKNQPNRHARALKAKRIVCLLFVFLKIEN